MESDRMINELLDKMFGHKCSRYVQEPILEPSIMSGVPIQTGYRCPICGKETKDTGAYYQNEAYKSLINNSLAETVIEDE